jgi:hypothetical protein
MFVRSKTIKGKRYAYLVHNLWRRKKAKQKVKKYLGRVIQLKQIQNLEPAQGKDSKEFVHSLLTRQLKACGFTQRTKNRFLKDAIEVDIVKGNVKADDKEIVLSLNGGYLYTKTLRDIRRLRHDPIEQRPGTNIAETFIKAGIQITQEEFIQLYQILQQEYED